MSEAREDRFCALYEGTRPHIIAYALRRTASRDDAADVVAETFEIAWRRLDDIPADHAGLLWLYVTARYVLSNHSRRVHRRDELAARLAMELRGVELGEDAPDEESVVMQLCLNALTPDERELLMLAGWEGLSAAQMGQVLGCSPTAARIRLHRARARLRSEMAESATAEKRPGAIEHIQDVSTAKGSVPEDRAMRRDATFRRLDPVDTSKVARVSSSRVFDDLGRQIMLHTEPASDPWDTNASPLGLRNQSRYRRPSIAFAVAAVTLLVVGLTVFGPGGGGRKGAITTPWEAARSLSVAPNGGATHQRSGTWTLVDDVLSGRWQQSLLGPPSGYLVCPSASTCYVMSGHYASADANAPLLSVSLYVSSDVGSTWSVLPMPQGFDPTSPLACGGIADCAAGGSYKGESVLVSTSDGGHSFVIIPLPTGDGSLYSLSCPSPESCAGLAATRSDSNRTPTDATFLSTSDGGSTFVDVPIVTGDSMQALACSSSLNCTAVGTSDALGVNDLTAGVATRTEDGGRTWVAGNFPSGFGVSYLSQLSCADALHCSVAGNIAITVANPPQCASVPQLGEGTTTTQAPTTAPSPTVQSVSQFESQAATSEILKDAQSQSSGFSCNSGGQTLISDIASSNDGGLTWTPDPLPADVPQPQLFGLSCPTDNECWAAGSDAVPQQIGNVHNGGSSVLLGTTDGGSTWSKVTFGVPTDAPNDEGQSYLSIGLITCPSANVCVAQGATAQSSPSAPFYSLVVPGSA